MGMCKYMCLLVEFLLQKIRLKTTPLGCHIRIGETGWAFVHHPPTKPWLQEIYIFWYWHYLCIPYCKLWYLLIRPKLSDMANENEILTRLGWRDHTKTSLLQAIRIFIPLSGIVQMEFARINTMVVSRIQRHLQGVQGTQH